LFLSKLEIFGFKSFADKTKLDFSREITGVVGPNGSGKTNIVDAIRWCLGEQKSSTLRSDKMENVIFNGTRNRKPMGMAEVSMTFINDKGVLPSEYSEITITRRIFRSGESEYLLNKNVCRLKDITNLFMDTGMGTNAYSVIELKMVENILSNRTDERRKMFEEAAGVNKYKLRRRLSLKKLDEVKNDLTRVNDIISEIEKNVRSLERQTKKAEKYNRLQAELRENELNLAEREFALFTIQRNSLAEEKNNLLQKKNGIDENIKNLEDKLIEYRNKISEKEEVLRAKFNQLSEISDKIHTNRKNISVAEERIKSLTENIENYKSDIEELKIQQTETEERLNGYFQERSRVEQKIEELSQVIETEAKTVEDKKIKLEEFRNVLKTKNESSLELLKNYNELETKLGSLENYKTNANKTIEKLNEKIQTLTSDIAKSVGYLENLETEKAKVTEELKKSETLYTTRLQEKEKLEQELKTLKEKELNEKGNLTNLKNKIEFYQSLITNLEGISGGSKILLESEGWTDKEKTLFADVGNTDEKYRLALEVALKNVLNNLLIADLDDLHKAVEYLKKNDLGKASFFLLGNGLNSKGVIKKILNFTEKRTANKIEKQNGFIGWASGLVKTNNNWLPYFRKILHKTAVVETLDDAIQFHKKYPDFNFATLEGDIITNNGIVEAGSKAKVDETLFGRKKLLEQLKEEYPKLEENLKYIQKLIAEKENAIAQIDLKVLSDQGNIILNDINNIEKQIAKFEFEKSKASEEIEKIQNEIQELINQIGQYEFEITELSQKLNSIKAEKTHTGEELAGLESGVRNVEDDYEKAVTELNAKRLQLERLKGELQNIINSINRSEESKKTIAETIERRKNEINSAHGEISRLKETIDSASAMFEELENSKSALEKIKIELDSEVTGMKSEMNELENKLSELRNERQIISDKIHDIELKNSETGIRLENLVETIRDEYAMDLEFKHFDDLDEFDFDHVSAEVHRLKNSIKNLGQINLLAFDEYEEEKQRLDFLLKQRDDLIESEKDLVNTINEINETAQQIFLSTFEEIRQNFIKIFRTLFNPGDEADLRLEEGVDPLEAKIEIIAKPKGKRPTSIELLSGGEKTLTATALLFAIYLVKPSPFCIMDEVDAPLDDANIDRFTNLLKEFSKNTQFIIVTHNKRTMEATETMYGVTMQEEGVSKLVGVRFNEDIKVSA